MKILLALGLLGLGTASQAHLTIFEGTFAPEAVGATGTGFLHMEYDEHSRTLAIEATWSGLSGDTNNAHIHCCTAAPNTGTAGVALAQSGLLPGFPLGIKSGSYIKVIDLTATNQYSSGFLNAAATGGTAAGAEARLISNLMSGNAYFNIHTTTFGGGEIRAFVTAVPEPQSHALMLAGLGMLGWAARRKQRA